MYFGHNDFSRAENLLIEGEVDPREVSLCLCLRACTCACSSTCLFHTFIMSTCSFFSLKVIVLFDDLLPSKSNFVSMAQANKLHGLPSVKTLGTVCNSCISSCISCISSCTVSPVLVAVLPVSVAVFPFTCMHVLYVSGKVVHAS